MFTQIALIYFDCFFGIVNSMIFMDIPYLFDYKPSDFYTN